MKRILIAKDKAYADNKAGDGAATALNPIDLAEGAVGIYGIPKTSTNNADKLALIIDDGSDAAGKVPDSAFDGDKIIIAVGLSGNQAREFTIDLAGEVLYESSEYVAPVAQVETIGYNSAATESNNMPTAVAGDVAGIKIKEQDDEPFAFNLQYEVRLDAAESDYSAITRLANKITDDADNDLVTVKVHSNGTGSAIANSATVAAVKGATSLTTSAAHGVGVGDYVILDGDLYKALTGTATTTLVIDSPYRGATATIANAATVDVGATVPTEVGLKFTGQTVGKELIISAYGNLAEATQTIVTRALQGQGSAAKLAEIEAMWQGRMGTAIKKESAYIPHPASQIVAGDTYDSYTFNFKNALFPKGDNNKITNVRNILMVAFPDGGSAGGQAEFEDIMGILLNGADGLGGLDAS